MGFGQETAGPASGSLVIAGGGRLGLDIRTTFIKLAGGPEASIVIIPTAGGDPSYGQDTWDARAFREAGAKNVTVLHANSKKDANTPAFLRKLEEADGIWFSGGRQWRLVDAYADTEALSVFHALLEKNGVIGGSSAGATIQGSYLARGDTRNNQIMTGDHEEGFGFISNIAIDQHLLARNRHFDMFTILGKYPHLLGIGIDERTAVVVNKNVFEVMGEGKVAIYDGTFWSREGSSLKKLPPANQVFYFLQPGDRYNISKRKVVED